MLEIIHIFYALQIAVFSYVFTCVLMKENYILEGYGDFLTKLSNYVYDPCKRAIPVGRWLAYPLGECEKCLAGQIALWSFIAFEGLHGLQDIFKVGLFITATIFITLTLSKIINKL